MVINVPRFLEIHGPWNFGNSWSMNFLEFMVHQLFGIQCPTIFCDFGLFNRLAQAGGGGPYYMIFHYQKHTVLNYWQCHPHIFLSKVLSHPSFLLHVKLSCPSGNQCRRVVIKGTVQRDGSGRNQAHSIGLF